MAETLEDDPIVQDFVAGVTDGLRVQAPSGRYELTLLVERRGVAMTRGDLGELATILRVLADAVAPGGAT